MAVGVPLRLVVRLGVRLAVRLGTKELEGVREVLGVRLGVMDGELDDEADGLPLIDGLAEPEGVTVLLGVDEAERLGVTLGVPLEVGLTDGVTLLVGVSVADGVGDVEHITGTASRAGEIGVIGYPTPPVPGTARDRLLLALPAVFKNASATVLPSISQATARSPTPPHPPGPTPKRLIAATSAADSARPHTR